MKLQGQNITYQTGVVVFETGHNEFGHLHVLENSKLFNDAA